MREYYAWKTFRIHESISWSLNYYSAANKERTWQNSGSASHDIHYSSLSIVETLHNI